MYYVIIDNITIIYSDKEKLCISKIIKYIKNNMDFFKSYQNKTLSFVPLEDEDTYYIDEFDFFFARIIRDFVDDPEVEILFKNHDFLIHSVAEYLYRSFFATKLSPLFKKASNSIIEIIVLVFAFVKNKIDLASLVEHLKTRREISEVACDLVLDNPEEYKSLINKIVDPELKKYPLKEYYSYFISNDLFKIPKKKNNHQISEEEVLNLFSEFLNYINASSKWQDTFMVLKDKNWLSFTDNPTSKIHFSKTGTIEDFLTLINEFINLLTQNNPPKSFSIESIPALFYENIGIEFLVKKGYDMEQLLEIKEHRKFKIMRNFLKDFSSYHSALNKDCNYFNELIETNITINQEILIALSTGKLKDLRPLEAKLTKQKEQFTNALKEKFLYTKDSIYPASLDIADQIYAKYVNDPTILKYMDFVTNEPQEFDLSILIYFLDLPDSYEKKRIH